ncbi:MAG: hypothetical protein ACI4QT_09645, partial [Kiritimatiellia bacterium]
AGRRDEDIAPYRNGTRACVAARVLRGATLGRRASRFAPQGNTRAEWLSVFCGQQTTRAVLHSGVGRRHYGEIREKSLLFFFCLVIFF